MPHEQLNFSIQKRILVSCSRIVLPYVSRCDTCTAKLRSNHACSRWPVLEMFFVQRCDVASGAFSLDTVADQVKIRGTPQWPASLRGPWEAVPSAVVSPAAACRRPGEEGPMAYGGILETRARRHHSRSSAHEPGAAGESSPCKALGAWEEVRVGRRRSAWVGWGRPAPPRGRRWEPGRRCA
jgi:hypothetical protein